MSQPVPQIHCEACGAQLPADTERACYCLACDLIVCRACWNVAASRCTACAARAMAAKTKRVGGSVSLRTGRRADRRLREAAKQAAVLPGDGPGAQAAARVDLACLGIKVVFAERVGEKALRRLTRLSAVRGEALRSRMRRHAVAARVAIDRVDATLTSAAMDRAPATVSAAAEVAPSAAEYREMHGPRLHGFAILLTLGDGATAGALAARALAAGASRAREQEDPRRGAAWLRRSVLLAVRRHAEPEDDGATRRAALDRLGVDGNAFAALSALNVVERAAVVASMVERLDQRDVATIVGLDEERGQRIVRDALRRATRVAMAYRLESDADGPVVTRVREIAAKALG